MPDDVKMVGKGIPTMEKRTSNPLPNGHASPIVVTRLIIVNALE
jgi:hypothetical protein